MAESNNLEFSIQQSFALAVQHMQAAQWVEAESIYRRILAERMDIPEVWNNLGQVQHELHKPGEAVDAFQRALALRPAFPEACNNLGNTLLDMGRPTEAIAAYRRALGVRPTFAEAWNNMSMALRQTNQMREAFHAAQQAVAAAPDFANAWNNLGVILQGLNRQEEAVGAYHRALVMAPDSPDYLNNLSVALREGGRTAEALAASRRAVTLRPEFVTAWSNLALAWKDAGRLDEAIACFDRAISLQPDQFAIQDNRLHTLYYHPHYDEMAIGREARKWNEQFAAPLIAGVPVYENDASPQRRLRIGYVSADFRRHCASLFMMPLLSGHDHQAFEIVCYSNCPASDPVTEQLRRHADRWCDISTMTDSEAADRVRQDRIDILVDLALHTAGNRLGVFARKPAPVQATWLGYPGTTGLDAIDYRLTDPRLDPHASNEGDAVNRDQSSLAGVEMSHYAERSVYLPDCFWCYDPRGMEDSQSAPMPEPGPLPALSAGVVTFGCLNNFCKVTGPTLELWSGVLAALPKAQLLLLAPLGEPRERLLQKLGVMGQDRVQFVPVQPRRQYLECYRRIDLCLDTVPCNGHTTSLDALWMGVPVLTRVGHTAFGRAGWSQLHQLGLTELVAQNDADFVKTAVTLAGDLGRLTALRAGLRQRMEASPLMDAKRFARHMESAYRQMWQAWVSGRTLEPSGMRSR